MNKQEQILHMRRRLREKLPKRWAETVASRCGKKKSRIYQIFRNWDTASPVFTEIIRLAEEHQENLKKLENLTSDEGKNEDSNIN
jgi:hypothetical protein